jgi:hypothetical protein
MSRGHYVEGRRIEPISDDLKERFLDLVANGYPRQEAAEALGETPRRFRALCSPKSEHYDEAFADEYEALTEKGGEHEAGLVERLRTAGLGRAIRSSDRLLEKYSVIYDPAWHPHRPQALQINVNIDELRAEFAQLPDAALKEYVALEEQKIAGVLEAGHPDIEQ